MVNVKEVIKDEILAIELVKDIGFADVSKYRKVPGGGVTPFEYLCDAKTAVVYIALMDEVIRKFGKWYVVSLNNFLKQTNEKVVAILEKHGLCSRGIIAERMNANLIGKVSYRQFAVLAGLGTIGKNTCLLHPRYGANVLLGVVLTNAHVSFDEPLNLELCVNCEACLKKCPVRAINNDFFDNFKCKNRRKILGKGCGTPCVVFCPLANH